MNTYYTALDAHRSAAAIELEAINTYLTIWFIQHDGGDQEISQYNSAIRQIRLIASTDLEESTLLVQLARDFYQSLFGHNWAERR